MTEQGKKQIFKAEFMVLCDYAFIGQNSKLGMIGVFDIIGIREVPTNHPEFFLVAHFKGEENSRHKIQLEIKDPLGNSVFKNSHPVFDINLSATGSGNMAHRFLNFPFKSAGVYKFVIKKEGKRLEEVELQVIKGEKNVKNRNMPN